MWSYCFKLAWLSLRKTPVMSSLTVMTVAVGIATCLTVLTLYSVISSNPMAHKNDRIFAVQLDSWHPDRPFPAGNGMPFKLTYRDAKAIFEADIAEQTVVMFKAGVNVSAPQTSEPPKVEFSRPTTNDFFAMFDVPFVHGGPWTDSTDREGGRVAVITEGINHRLFGGKNSVGEPLMLEGEMFTIVGVVSDDWQLLPTVYDPVNNPFEQPPQVYFPLFNVNNGPYPLWSGRSGWKYEEIDDHQDFLNSETVWLQLWLGFASAQQKQQAEQFIRHYIQEQKAQGRFERPLKFQLNSPSQWLDLYQVVKKDDRVLLFLSFAFLLVCLVNASVLLLAKQFRKAPETGIRRALGASQQDIFAQHLTEALVIACGGSLLGLGLAYFGLEAVRNLYNNYDAVAVINGATVTGAIALAIGATAVSGLIPAWRVSRTASARYLKAQ